MSKSLSRLALGALGAAALACSIPAHAGKTIDTIKQRGELVCGVNPGLAGFAAPDSQGKYSGLDIDYCKGLAAALLGDANKVRYVPLTAPQRFTALQSGEIDVLSRNTTWTLTRDASLGMHFVGVNFYDGQGFIVPKSLNVKSAKHTKGATVCVHGGTTTELNLTDYSRANNLQWKPVVFDNQPATNAAYFSGRCQIYTTDASGLAAIRSKEAKNPADHVILPELISKEPLGPSIRRGDDEFFAIAKWVLNVMLEAEELGITQANVEKMKAESKNPGVMRVLGGGSEDSGKALGLDKDWAYRVIKAVGNYGESFERNVGPTTPVGLPRGSNALWTQGGLMYAPPVR